MLTMERRHEPAAVTTMAAGGGPAGPSLDQVRSTTQRMFDAADAAIRAALSTDSETYLNNNRQQGGQ
jgi:hypothetical protein